MAKPSIRPLERADVADVASLYEAVARSGSRTPPPGLAASFEETFFEQPWVDPEIPSLVYMDEDGRIAGFLGSSVRRATLDGRSIRVGVSGQLVTEPRVRAAAAGMFLMREYMRGRQDLTISDTASAEVRRIWERLGGDAVQLHCVGWARVFKPARFVGDYLDRRSSSRRTTVALRTARAFETLTGPLIDRVLKAPRPQSTRSENLTSQAVVENLDAVVRDFRLHLDYEVQYLDWLFHELAEVSLRGELIRRLVRTADGQVRGWYLYYLVPGAIAQVLQVAAAERDAGEVLDDLFRDAHERGAAGLQGRVEGHLLEGLGQRKCVFHASGYLALVHGRSADALAAVHSGRALLTRADGEWWMGHHLQPFD